MSTMNQVRVSSRKVRSMPMELTQPKSTVGAWPARTVRVWVSAHTAAAPGARARPRTVLRPCRRTNAGAATAATRCTASNCSTSAPARWAWSGTGGVVWGTPHLTGPIRRRDAVHMLTTAAEGSARCPLEDRPARCAPQRARRRAWGSELDEEFVVVGGLATGGVGECGGRRFDPGTRVRAFAAQYGRKWVLLPLHRSVRVPPQLVDHRAVVGIRFVLEPGEDARRDLMRRLDRDGDHPTAGVAPVGTVGFQHFRLGESVGVEGVGLGVQPGALGVVQLDHIV